MSTLTLQFEQIQPCDGRDLIQVLTATAIERVVEIRSKLCTQASDIFAQYGFDNFNPCTDLNEEFFELLKNTQPIIAIEYILNTKGFPPHILTYLKAGAEGLTDEQFQAIIEWTSIPVGVNFPNNTAAYIRDRSGRAPILLPQQALEVEQALIQQGVQEVTTLLQDAITTFILQKLKCPPEEVVQRLISIVQSIILFLNAFLRTFELFKQAINTASALVSVLNATLQGLKAAVVANDAAIIAATATGVGIAATPPLINANRLLDKVVTKYSDRIQELDDRLCAAGKTVTYVDTTLDVIYALVQAVEQLLLICLPDGTTPPELTSRLVPRSFTAPEGGSYRGYRFEVRTRLDGSQIAPRRYAVALDRQGIVVLEGTPSFSADTQILIDELKFRIDNQLG